MNTIRVTAKTLDEAITKALIELGTTSDNLDYTIIEKGSAGLFGFIGGKSFVIEAKRKKSEEELFEELTAVPKTKKEEPVKKEGKQSAKPAGKQEKQEKKPAAKQSVKPDFKAEPKQEVKSAAKAEPKQESKPAVKAEPKQEIKPVVKAEVKQESKPAAKAEPKQESKPAVKEEPKQEVNADAAEAKASSSKKYEDGSVYEAAAKNFLNQMFTAMKMEVEIQASFDESDKELSVDMSGADMGILIGKRGQTLDSLQYLVSLVVNKDSEGYVRVKLDTENYRERRKETLEILAKNIAYKVKRTRKPVSLEPMNPYERRIIHAALQNDKYVVTRSDGEDPFRHVVISLKRENRDRRNNQEHRNSQS